MRVYSVYSMCPLAVRAFAQSRCPFIANYRRNISALERQNSHLANAQSMPRWFHGRRVRWRADGGDSCGRLRHQSSFIWRRYSPRVFLSKSNLASIFEEQERVQLSSSLIFTFCRLQLFIHLTIKSIEICKTKIAILSRFLRCFQNLKIAPNSCYHPKGSVSFSICTDVSVSKETAAN